MKSIGIAALMLVGMFVIVAEKAAQDDKRLGVIGAVIGSAASVSVLAGLYVAAHHILG
jgi:hypothetical protein